MQITYGWKEWVPSVGASYEGKSKVSFSRESTSCVRQEKERENYKVGKCSNGRKKWVTCGRRLWFTKQLSVSTWSSVALIRGLRKCEVSVHWRPTIKECILEANSPLSKYSTHHAQNLACTYVFLQDVCPGKHYTPHSGMIYPCGFFGKIKHHIKDKNVQNAIRINCLRKLSDDFNFGKKSMTPKKKTSKSFKRPKFLSSKNVMVQY